MLVVYVGLFWLTGWRLTATPQGFIPHPGPGQCHRQRGHARPAPRWTRPTRWCAIRRESPGHARRRRRLHLRRGGRRHPDHLLQRRADVCHLRQLQGAGEAPPDHRQTSSPPSRRTRGGDHRRGNQGAAAAPGARHRHRGRLQDDRRGPERRGPRGAGKGDAARWLPRPPDREGARPGLHPLQHQDAAPARGHRPGKGA